MSRVENLVKPAFERTVLARGQRIGAGELVE